MSLLDLTLSELWRHKVRSVLTVFGVILAIAAIVSLGSISEGINELAQSTLKQLGGLITIAERGQSPGFGGGPIGEIDISIVDEISDMDGVEKVVPILVRQMPKVGILIGLEENDAELMNVENIGFKDGRWPSIGERGLLLGSAAAEGQGYVVGDTIRIEDVDFEVVGILDKTSTFMDYGTITSFETIREVFEIEDYVNRIFVKPEDAAAASSVATAINDQFDSVDALTQEDAAKKSQESINQIRVVTLAIGVISAIVAAIGIANTMIMSVFERRRELGIMKALGAERGVVIMQVIQEAIIIAIIGSVVGILLGFGGAAGLNSQMGLPLAKVTLLLVVASFIFGLGISLLASIYPAWEAVKVDPVIAMREE